MKLVTAVIKPHKWEEVREALETFGVTGHDRQRGQRLRPPEGPHRGLPRRGVRHRARAQDPDRDRRRRRRRRGRRRASSSRRPRPAASATARSGSVPSTRSSGSAPGTGTRQPSREVQNLTGSAGETPGRACRRSPTVTAHDVTHHVRPPRRAGGHQDRHRRHRLAPRRCCPGPADGPGPGPVLRRHGPLEGVLNMMMMTFGALAVIVVIWVLVGYSLAFGDDLGGGLLGDPTAVLRVPRDALRGRRDLAHRAHDPLRHLPGAVLRDHRGAGLRRHRRPGPLRCLDRLRLDLDRARLCADRPLGLRLRPRGSHRWLAGEQARPARLRGRHGGRDQLRRLGAGAGAGRRRPRRLRQGADAAAQPDAGDARRRTAVVRLVRLQRRLCARRQPHRGGGVRDHAVCRCALDPSAGCSSSASATDTRHRWALRRAWSPGWSPSRRAAARSRPIGAMVMGLASRSDLRPRRRAEVPLRLRRLARRRRRAPRRRPGRAPSASACSRRRPRRPAWTGCSTAAASTSSASSWSAVARWCLRVRRVGHHRLGGRTRLLGLPDRRGARDQRHRPGDPRRDRLRPARHRRQRASTA